MENKIPKADLDIENKIPKADLESEYRISGNAVPIRQNGNKNANGQRSKAKGHQANNDQNEGSNNATPFVAKSDDFYD